MAKELLDAVKTATSIHDGDYSSLHGKYFVVCGKIKKKKGQDDTVKKPRMTLAKLAEQMNSRFDRIESRINNLEKDVKDINTRLDYIVDANNLKDNR